TTPPPHFQLLAASAERRRNPDVNQPAATQQPTKQTDRAMTKRLVDIDDDVLDAARAALGTRTLKETVNGALEAATALAARRRHLERFRADGLPDLRKRKVMAQAWQ